MIKYHAVMLDETRCEFGVSFEAENLNAAHEYLKEQYEESSCIQLETIEQAQERERQMYLSIEEDYYAQGDYDPDLDD